MLLKKVAIVFNPKGGSAKKHALARLTSILRALGIVVTSHETTPEFNSAFTLASAATQNGTDLLIAVGGDGTVRSVAQAAAAHNCNVAIFPGGTGNLFARNFYSAPTAERFAQMILDGTPQPVDLIRYEGTDIEGRAFSGNSLVGMDFGCLSEAICGADPVWKRRFGRLVYVYRVGKAALSPKRVNAQFSTGEKRFSADVSAAYMLNVAPNMVSAISRGCSPCDGMLDLVLLKGASFGQLLSSGFWAFVGAPERCRHYARYRMPSVNIEMEQPVQLDIDGDPGPITRQVNLSVLPGAVRIILA